jgi:predicted nucleic acid-binding protein
MPPLPLTHLPAGAEVFVDANILVYALSGKSAQCLQLLDRCVRGEVTGVCLFEVLNEATHRLMLLEAVLKGIIVRGAASDLRKHYRVIPTLSDYWRQTESLLNSNLLLLPTEEAVLRGAQAERRAAGLLTNDSMIVSCMRLYGLTALAMNDDDFERVAGLDVFRPDDIP